MGKNVSKVYIRILNELYTKFKSFCNNINNIKIPTVYML